MPCSTALALRSSLSIMVTCFFLSETEKRLMQKPLERSGYRTVHAQSHILRQYLVFSNRI